MLHRLDHARMNDLQHVVFQSLRTYLQSLAKAKANPPTFYKSSKSKHQRASHESRQKQHSKAHRYTQTHDVTFQLLPRAPIDDDLATFAGPSCGGGRLSLSQRGVSFFFCAGVSPNSMVRSHKCIMIITPLSLQDTSLSFIGGVVVFDQVQAKCRRRSVVCVAKSNFYCVVGWFQLFINFDSKKLN